jgi:hypothetical protein
MLRTHKMLSLGVSSLMIAGLAVAASAQSTTSTQTATVALTPTNVNTNMSFAQFDPSLGTLTSITINLTGTAFSTASVNSITAPGSNAYEFDSASTTHLQRPGGINTLITVLPFNPETQNLGGASDPALPFTFPNNTATDTSGPTIFSGASDLTLFTGPGTILLPFKVNGSSGVNGPGTINSSVSTQGGGSATLFYTYTAFTTATPEPGTWAMLIAGASTGLVALRRRRNKK